MVIGVAGPSALDDWDEMADAACLGVHGAANHCIRLSCKRSGAPVHTGCAASARNLYDVWLIGMGSLVRVGCAGIWHTM